MKLKNLPILSTVLEFGAEDRIFDTLLLSGPLLLVLIGILHRSSLTTGLAIVYIGSLVVYVLYQGVKKEINTDGLPQ